MSFYITTGTRTGYQCPQYALLPNSKDPRGSGIRSVALFETRSKMLGCCTVCYDQQSTSCPCANQVLETDHFYEHLKIGRSSQGKSAAGQSIRLEYGLAIPMNIILSKNPNRSVGCPHANDFTLLSWYRACSIGIGEVEVGMWLPCMITCKSFPNAC